MANPMDSIKFREVHNGSAITWTFGDVEFFGIRLDHFVDSSIEAAGAVKFTGITGDVKKDKLVHSHWRVYVKKGDGSVTSEDAWMKEQLANAIAKSTGAPAELIFKDVHSTTQGS